MHKREIEVSLFVEPEIEQIDAASEIESDYIEIHTGTFANALTEADKFDELEKVRLAAKHAKKLGLGVNAGHGLNYSNIKIFREVENIDEVSIGQAVIARAMFVGLEKAIQEMIRLVN